MSEHINMELKWMYTTDLVNWDELSELFRMALMGEKPPHDLRKVFNNSRYKCFVYEGNRIIGVGRALADGADCSYICDVAVHPRYQGKGHGREVVKKLIQLSEGHKKIILYANPGKIGFYESLGFSKMTTAMAIFSDENLALSLEIIEST